MAVNCYGGDEKEQGFLSESNVTKGCVIKKREHENRKVLNIFYLTSVKLQKGGKKNSKNAFKNGNFMA